LSTMQKGEITLSLIKDALLEAEYAVWEVAEEVAKKADNRHDFYQKVIAELLKRGDPRALNIGIGDACSRIWDEI